MTEQFTRVPNRTDASEFPIAVQPQKDALVAVVSQREIAEAQGALLLAQRFPRDELAARERILITCQRPGLAEGAIYTYARGGTNITGPSIRLAEAIAQTWGNLTFGIRELEQRHGESTMEAFAWDLERNVRQIKVFQVRHVRHAKGKIHALETPRDIYEEVANQGARRMRACILGLIPGDIVEAAVEECEKTLTAKADTSAEGVKKMLTAFEKYGVTKEQIEERLQRKLDAMTAAQMIGLVKIYTSLKDGMSVPGEWFGAAEESAEEAEAEGGNAKAREALKRQQEGKKEGPPAEAPAKAAQEASPEEPPTQPEEPPADSEAESDPEVKLLVQLKAEMTRCFAPDGEAGERWLQHRYGKEKSKVGQLSGPQVANALGALESVKKGALRGWTRPAGKGEGNEANNG